MKTFVFRLSVLAGAGALALALSPAASAGQPPTPASGSATAGAGQPAGRASQPAGSVGRLRTPALTGSVSGHPDLDGSCDTFWDDQTGDLCLLHSQASSSSLVDLWLAPCDLASFNFVFISPGDGQGQPVFNNWAVAVNADPRLAVRMFTGPNCSNPVGDIPPFGQLILQPGVVVQGFQFVPENVLS